VDDDLDKNFRPGQVIRYVRTGAVYLLLNSREKANDDLTWFGGHSHYYDGYVLYSGRGWAKVGAIVGRGWAKVGAIVQVFIYSDYDYYEILSEPHAGPDQ
jgi:hypothetical protein